MRRDDSISPKVRSLIDAVCNGDADDAQIRALESHLLIDAKACELYVDLLNVDAKLRWIVRSSRQAEAAVKRFVDVDAPPVYSPALDFVSSTLQGVTAYLNFNEHPGRFSYLATSILFVIVWFAASHIYVTTHSVQNVAENSPNQTPSDINKELPSAIEQKMSEIEYVGRVTGEVDCKWEVKGLGIGNRKLGKDSENRKPLVALGDKLVISSGLMEITYDTGAKVILQGPVTYEAEVNGGYLAVGKLTGKLEKKVVSGESGVGSESSPQPLAPSPFVIRTPTATVTDLGTEFGVEVSEDASARVCILDGKVRVEDRRGRTRYVTAGDAVHVTSERISQIPSDVIARRFVRAIQTPAAVNGSFVDHFRGKASPHWINPQVADWSKNCVTFNGNRHDGSDRAYLYTVGDYDYAGRDFVATVRITNSTGPEGCAFFGLGDGQRSNFYGEPGVSPPFVYMIYYGSNSIANIGLANSSADDRANHFFSSLRNQPAGTTITARFAWTAATRTAVFSIDADNDGVFDESVTISCPDFASSGNPTPGRLFIGGAGGARFSDFNVTVGSRAISPVNKSPAIRPETNEKAAHVKLVEKEKHL